MSSPLPSNSPSDKPGFADSMRLHPNDVFYIPKKKKKKTTLGSNPRHWVPRYIWYQRKFPLRLLVFLQHGHVALPITSESQQASAATTDADDSQAEQDFGPPRDTAVLLLNNGFFV
jgi:hypothetical protein